MTDQAPESAASESAPSTRIREAIGPWRELAEAPEILAGLSLMTLLNIKHGSEDYLQVTYSGPMDHLPPEHPHRGKYAGWITTPPHGRPLINTEAYFDTAEDAIEHMRRIIEACKAYTS